MYQLENTPSETLTIWQECGQGYQVDIVL